MGMKVFRLAVSYLCPFRCAICYAPHENVQTPLELVSAAIRNARDEGFDEVAIGGGEPLYTLQHTLKTIQWASDAGLLNAMTTSGYGLSEEVLRQLENAGLNHLQLSLGDGRVNLIAAYRFMTSVKRHCGFGVNLLLSPRLLRILPELIQRFDSDHLDQISLLVPKGNTCKKFTEANFMHYAAILQQVKTSTTQLLIDCATQQTLHGHCDSQGCTLFPDGTVSRCGFGCGPRLPWNGSLAEILSQDSGQCREAIPILTKSTWR